MITERSAAVVSETLVDIKSGSRIRQTVDVAFYEILKYNKNVTTITKKYIKMWLLSQKYI